ncbi:hypothetical protein BMS3Bbin04_00130 [bacterium BMS3Bbin04]|nr:hypothetical protein BMS3Bbin04_00130 [bacterium BMS3Bbin04]
MATHGGDDASAGTPLSVSVEADKTEILLSPVARQDDE